MPVFEPGTVVAEKYRIERNLGRGGMGVVIAAQHLELRIAVALKFLSDRHASRPEVVTRFLREAQAAARLQSPHACRVFDVARLPDGTPFIVMELLVGRDLAKLLRATGPLDESVAADYIAQACRAIAEAHALGVVHRDLKPSNLFLARQRDGAELIKVLDFGVAKIASEDPHDFAITTSRAVIGSPNYMAPEQLRSARTADARSDIWSLGVILHQLVSGQLPFHGASAFDVAVSVATDPAPPLLRGSAAYRAIVARCLEKPPELRYQSVAELLADLAPLALGAAAERTVPASQFASADPTDLDVRVLAVAPGDALDPAREASVFAQPVAAGPQMHVAEPRVPSTGPLPMPMPIPLLAPLVARAESPALEVTAVGSSLLDRLLDQPEVVLGPDEPGFSSTITSDPAPRDGSTLDTRPRRYRLVLVFAAALIAAFALVAAITAIARG